MSIVEKIQNLPENTVTQDDNFIMLSEALSEYHRLIITNGCQDTLPATVFLYCSLFFSTLFYISR